MIFKKSKSQISVIEVIFLVVLFFSFIFYLTINLEPTQTELDGSLNTLIDSIYNNLEYRNLIMDENLSSMQPSQNWTDFKNFVNLYFNNFEFEISNDTVKKKIFDCDSSLEYLKKSYVQRIIAIKNNTKYEVRYIKLGYCY